MCLRDTLYLFLAIAIIAYALRQIKFTQLLYFLYVSLNFLRNFYFYAFYTFFFFFYLFIRHIDIYMFPLINFLKNLQSLQIKSQPAYGSAFLLGTSLATLFIKKILPISIIIGIITLVLIYLINYLFLSKFLHVSSNLQQ